MSIEDVTDFAIPPRETAPDGAKMGRATNLSDAVDRYGLVTGRARLGTLVMIRWLALAGQILSVLVVHFGFGIALPIEGCMAIIGFAALTSVVTALRRPGTSRLRDSEAAAFLGFDVVELSALLLLTGGILNPFVVLIVAPVAIAASLLSLRSTIMIAGVATAAVTILALWYVPLPLTVVGARTELFTFGLWLAMVLAVVFLAGYMWRVANDARTMSDALTATQMALAREQQMSAVGALAAAVAHELGSPLSTIAVVGREIARALPSDSPLAEDAQQLVGETQRCRVILSRLETRPDSNMAGDPFSEMGIGSLVQAAAAPHHSEIVRLVHQRTPHGGPEVSEPRVRRSPEILYGLGSIIQNAVQFAQETVVVTTAWTRETVTVTVCDDGPGFSPEILGKLGEPYLSTRKGEGDHMGLGVFIAHILLERTGATLQFSNAPGRGAKVAVVWNRVKLERVPD